MELAYALQFGSAKDPINMAGFVAAGMLRGDHPQISIAQLDADQSFILLDVRTSKEFAANTIPRAVNIPIDELRLRMSELPIDRSIVAFCRVGQRGYLATRILLQAGYAAASLSGGYQTYLLYSHGGHHWPLKSAEGAQFFCNQLLEADP